MTARHEARKSITTIEKLAEAPSAHRTSQLSKRGLSPGVLILATFLHRISIYMVYMVLFISRVREYGADAFSVKLTRKPEALIRALAKIGYGLLDTEKQQNRKRLPIDALQIQNSSAGREMACWVGEDSPVRFDLRKTFMNS